MREQLGGDPRTEAVFVFHNRRRTHVKILWHDGRGYCLLYRRLDRGTYCIPLAIPPAPSRCTSPTASSASLLRGIDRALLREARRSAAYVTTR